jgi:predicted DNA-binding transcriptional regulator AlpA
MDNPFTQLKNDIDRIGDVVQKIYQEISEKNSMAQNNTKKLISRKDVAQEFGVCLSTVDNLVRQGILEKRKHGRIVRFDIEQVRTALQSYQKHQHKDPYFG